MKLGGKGKVVVFEKPTPLPEDDWVVVKVTSSGICGTDIELLLPAEQPLPTIPGHEVAGVVAAVDRAKKVKVGDRVMVNCHVTCNTCEHCLKGDVIFCPQLRVIGFELDGGDAEYLLIPEASLRLLPDDISDEVGVLIADALGTPYHAAKKAGIRPGEYVGVFGVGPLGQMAVLSAKSFGAKLIAVDLNERRLETARKFGADHTINPQDPDSRKQILALTGNRGLDRSLECSGAASAIHLSLNTLTNRGKHVQVGVCTKIELNPFEQINNREIEIVGSRNFNNNELPELLDFVRRHPEVQAVITHRFPLEQAPKAFEIAARAEGLKILLKP